MSDDMFHCVECRLAHAELAEVKAERDELKEAFDVAGFFRLHNETVELKEQLAAGRAEVERLKDDLLHATAEEGDWLSKASRRMCDTVMRDRDAERQRVRDRNATIDLLRALLGECAETFGHDYGVFCQTHNGGSCNCDYPDDLLKRINEAVKS